MQDKKIDNKGSNTFRTKLYHNSPSTVLSKDARQRLKWMEHFTKYRNIRLTCRHFAISADTFYLWKNRYNPNDLLTLEDNKRNRKPHSVRGPKYTKENTKDIAKLKDLNPKLGKIMIARILKEKGSKISASTVGRILRLISPSQKRH